jgi:hypothetical protein
VDVLDQDHAWFSVAKFSEKVDPGAVEALARFTWMKITGHVKSKREAEDLLPPQPLDQFASHVVRRNGELLVQDLA